MFVWGGGWLDRIRVVLLRGLVGRIDGTAVRIDDATQPAVPSPQDPSTLATYRMQGTRPSQASYVV